MDSVRFRYPIYIVSKGRWKNPLTAKIFLKHNIDFKIVIEPQEYNNYLTTIPDRHILCTNFSNLGLGSYPARNFAWDHSMKVGFKKHFLFDDNIASFLKFTGGKRYYNYNATECLENLITFTEKFKNVAISSFNYSAFVRRESNKPFTINTKCYSGMLINNEIPYRWRLKYNEDIDLCFQALHNGWNTIQLNYYAIDKVSTSMKMQGGNQDELYKGNDTAKKLLKAKTLEMIWPQYVKTVWRFGRPHHSIQWNKHFKHPLQRIVG